uniref:Integrase catalytic domain-containing protein n=1 Tax=Photinus pyralis TaxID=7054 RepID=A0A1Y1JY37_PHOPY
MFVRHGIPLTLVTDGGSRFSSCEFKVFAKNWEFNHILTSPTNAQSNGMAERNVQTAKKMLKKIIEDNKDLQMALLTYRNQKIDNDYSPARLVNLGRFIQVR